ncbi:ABC transporter permease [Streptomyces sp. NBC_01387]|uniref:ABC transporter permease n=1 Tax=unclassified Streptomyces TaxID=2593676 RepID=UPI002023BD1C|nr:MULTISPECIES: ABC transporter permease [unclassified Streptomyces]MCX4553363.1 ABC transporter permease [Streptomyces sp. NBC_01500]WSC18326.1 ABC transporter permease [Streptomyces sp. NBC_01766]
MKDELLSGPAASDRTATDTGPADRRTENTGAVSTDPATAKRQNAQKNAQKKKAQKKAGGTGRLTAVLLGFASAALGLLTWVVLANSGIDGFPGPVSVARRAGQLIADGTLFSDAGASLERVLIGYVLGVVLAIPVGFLMGWYPVVRRLIEPWLQFFRMVPPLAIIPLAIVLMGIDETPKIFVIFLASFLSSVVSTFQGVVAVDVTLVNAARVLGARDPQVFIGVVVPASTPFILVGMRIGLGASWATVVAAELIAAQDGLGHRMQQAQLYYDLPTIFVQVIAIGAIGLVMDRLLLLAERRLTHWQERR